MIPCGRRCERLNDGDPACRECGAYESDNPPAEHQPTGWQPLSPMKNPLEDVSRWTAYGGTR